MTPTIMLACAIWSVLTTALFTYFMLLMTMVHNGHVVIILLSLGGE